MLITQYAGTLLRQELDRIPLWKGNAIGVKDLVDYFARYVYLPRLKNSEVLLAAIGDGASQMFWLQETFAYAESWDESHQRYLGLKAGQQVNVAMSGLVVKPEIAAAQIAEDMAAQARQQQPPVSLTYSEPGSRPGSAVSERGGDVTPELPVTVQGEQQGGITYAPYPQTPGGTRISAPVEAKHRRFHGSVQINPRMMAGEAGKIMDEVVKHLTTLYGANVRVTLEIEAMVPDGVSEETKRTVEENCRTLRFEGFGFEEE